MNGSQQYGEGAIILDIKTILSTATELGASDIFLIGGLPLTYKIHGRQQRVEPENRLMPEELRRIIGQLYSLTERPAMDEGGRVREDDFSFALPGCGRFRANVFYQRGSLSAVIRVIQFGVPDPVRLNIPESVMALADIQQGLVLVTGPSGSGKSSTLACLIDRINENYERTIITMEDPIEIVHPHKKSIIIQREISTDTESFSTALRAAMRESPDVLLVGEARDAETMEVAMTAAETGQLLFCSMHTLSAADTVDRIVDAFPEKKQPQIRAQLARVLRCVVCQKLLRGVDGHMLPAFEIMYVTPAVQNLIREGKTYQFNSIIQEGGKNGMLSMNSSLLRLVREGRVDRETALCASENPIQLEKRLSDA